MSKILIAEDEAPIAKAFSLKLGAAGFDVTIAPDGEAALEQLKAGTFDLLILDMVMPKRDGIGVLEGMQEAQIATPVVVATNLSQSEDVDRIQTFPNVKDYFVKSETSISDMVARVQSALAA